MTHHPQNVHPPIAGAAHTKAKTSVCIDWYAEGETKVVEVDGIRITVRFIGRKGRRGRIAIEAPAGAVFRAADRRVVMDRSTSW
jgi:hypothetical protein